MLDAARLKRLAPYAVVAAGAGYLYYAAAGIRYAERAGVLGPDFWPKSILVLILLVCACKIAAAFFPAPRAAAAAASGEADAESHPWLVVGGMALSAGYVWAITRVGFFTATVPYLAAFIVLGGYRRWGVVAAVSGIGALALLFFFMKVVYVSLPLGQEPFLQVTLALMKLMGIR
ncbi:MAG: tripartite tricarboxylate transporter TctB family protein [Betaproteobacteria bacterium]